MLKSYSNFQSTPIKPIISGAAGRRMQWGSGDALPWGSTAGRAAVRMSFNRPYAASTNPAAAFGMGAGEFLCNVQPVNEGYPISSAGWDYNLVRWLEREGYYVTYVTNVDTHEFRGIIECGASFH